MMASPSAPFSYGPQVPGITVVNQQPATHGTTFPLRFHRVNVLVISILTCIVGFLQFITGICNIFFVPFYTSFIAFPVWCGLLFVVTGIFGCCTYHYQTKCLIGSFLGLSISSLLLTVVQLGFQSATMRYFVKYSRLLCNFYGSCWYVVSPSVQDQSLGLTGFLLFLILLQMSLFISAVVYASKAYSKCCNTCNVNDCSTCIGCCECDCRSVPYMQHQASQQSTLNQTYPMAQRQNNLQNAINQASSLQQGMTQNSNPCSALFNIIIQLPGVSRVLPSGGPQSEATDNNTVHITIQNSNNTVNPDMPAGQNVYLQQMQATHPSRGAQGVQSDSGL